MSRWRPAAPAHSDPWRAWLTYHGSLTRRIVERAGTMRVEIVGERLRFPNDDEYAALGRPRHRLAFVREVVLHAGGGPVVLAHSIAARRDLDGAWHALRGLGTRPLAAMLFGDPRVRRAPFEYARIDPRHPLWKRACRLLGARLPALRARRSRFTLRGRPLVVTEVFLPSLGGLGR
ncbi:MAG TPA: chorismate lyase [Usitatibacter sp.]|nr:chorismate lyase [Usitatibacter sp.]